MSDPFRPHSSRTAVAVPTAPAPPVDGLETLPKNDLVAQAIKMGLATNGTRPDLAARIRAAR